MEKYQVLGYIASGTYGRVYKAVQNESHYAIKRFKPEKEALHGISTSAIREMALCRELNHENIIRLVDIILDSTSKSIQMVFDYCEHDFLVFSLAFTLKQILHHHSHHLKGIPIPEYTVKSFLWQLLRGVDYLHTNYVIHRDLKPANILVTHAGVVKIADLGLSRIYHQPLMPLCQNDKVIVYLVF